MKVIFLKVYLGDNPSLAVKILNVTPRPRERERGREGARERKK